MVSFERSLPRRVCAVFAVLLLANSAFSVDSDWDGLTNEWEVANGRDPSIADYQISAGTYHTCALDDAGVVCWGYNQHGQVVAPELIDPMQVSAGGGHSCALDQSGVVCWGYNEYEQTTVPALNTPVQITTGFDHSCALHRFGVRCWGANEYGQTTVPWLRQPSRLSAGFEHTCAIDNTGVVCWGYNGSGQTSVPSLANPSQISAGFNHTCAIHDSGVRCWGDDQFQQSTVPALSNPTHVSAGFDHTCAIDASGVVCWGNNDYGQITVPELEAPLQITTGFDYTCALDALGVTCWGNVASGQTLLPSTPEPAQVSMGFEHACARYSDSVACWGQDASGQATVPALSNPSAVSAGFDHTCALDRSGVICWGYNEYGQTTVPSLAKPTSVASGGDHSCAIDDARVVCWGYGDSGQTTPPVLFNPSQVSAGFDHTCALDDTGIKCWGDNEYGQRLVPELEAPTIVDAGFNHNCALDANDVVCWGDTQFGQTQVPELNAPSHVSAGYDHTCVLDENTVLCWGSDQYSQSTVPTLLNPVTVSAGFYNTCAIDDSGLVCWGSENYTGLIAPELLIDPDGDSYVKGEDAFPLDASEWLDTDGDGVGDNLDVFDDDASEWRDSDGDGYGDNADVFDDDASEWRDSDGDGVGDNADVFDDDASEWFDTDQDGVGNNVDKDDDGDGVSDQQETLDGSDPLDEFDCNICSEQPLSGIVYHWRRLALLESVTLNLEWLTEDVVNDISEEALSDASGFFTFTKKRRGTHRLTSQKVITAGESGSVISSADALAALKIAVGINPNPDPDGLGPREALPVSPYQYIAADINEDGRVTSADALDILKLAVNLSTAKPRRWVFVAEDYDFWDELANNGAGGFNVDRSHVNYDSGVSIIEYPAQRQQNVVGILIGDVNGSWEAPQSSSNISDNHVADLVDSRGGSLAQWGKYDTQSAVAQPNILLIIADDQGVDASAQYPFSVDVPTTPTLNKLASQGIVFDNAWATPACTTSRATMMTGQYGVNSGVVSNDDSVSSNALTLHRYLANSPNSSNYASALIGKWGLGGSGVAANHPATLGIEYFAGTLRRAISDYNAWDLTVNGVTTAMSVYNTTASTDLAIDWIANQSQPWFLWLAYTAPHDPIHVPPEHLHTRNLSGTDSDRSSNPRAYYLAAIEAMDSEIGRLLQSFDEQQLENTIILYVGDNGTPTSVIDTTVFSKGKSSVSEGGLKVPMVVSGSGVSRENSRESALINVTDFFATISQLAGNDTPQIADSISFMGLFSNADSPSREYSYVDFITNGITRWAIRDERYKLIVSSSGTKQLYDLLNDPYEDTNLLRAGDQYQSIESRLFTAGMAIRPQTDGAVHTAGIECSYSYDVFNDSAWVDMQSWAHWQCDESLRTLIANGVPDHAVGRFPNANNPNSIAAQTISETFTLSPEKTSLSTTLGGPRGATGYILNGVKIDAGTAGTCSDNGTSCRLAPPIQGSWSIEALGQDSFNFGDDANHAHVQPTGAYHYHGIPEGFVSKLNKGVAMTLIGWAADGFPIYARFGYAEAMNASSEVVSVNSSFRMKTVPDANRASVSLYEMGTFTQDYEYLEGSGDLDECNGRSGVTPEFPEGIYHYFATDAFPFLPRCIKGSL